ncbi:unnamed protein product, partial [Closterium sp. NIES-53]
SEAPRPPATRPLLYRPHGPTPLGPRPLCPPAPGPLGPFLLGPAPDAPRPPVPRPLLSWPRSPTPLGLQPHGPAAATTIATTATATPTTASATAATTATAVCCATMASLRVLEFDHEGRPVQFDTWLDDLQLYLLSDSKDSVSLFDLASGAASAPPATADLEDRVSHLRTSVARYRATVPAESLDRFQPLMFITPYFIVTRLPDSLRSVKDHFSSLDPTSLNVDLLEQHLLVAETSAVAEGAARGTPRTPFFEGYFPSPLSPSYASAAVADVSVAEEVGAASASAKHRNSKGKGGRGIGGGSGGGGGGSGSGRGGSSGGGGGGGGGNGGGTGGGSGGSGGGSGGSGGSGSSGGGGNGGGRTGPRRGGPRGGQRQQQQRQSKTQSPQQLREWLFQRGTSGGSDSYPYVIRTGVRAGQTCGKLHTQHRCFSRLDDAWRAQFGDDVERPRSADLLRSGVAIFDLDYDAILSPMYALSASAEGDCYWCVPPDLGLAAAALGASESGTLPGTAPAQALHTFMLDSGASCWSSLYTLANEPPHILLWHHCLGHPSLPCLRGMHSRLLVSCLPRSLPPLPTSPAPPCLPCFERRQRAAPHSSSFPPMSAPLQTLHMDVCGLARDLPVLRLHSDRGGEFSSDLLRDFCRGEGILPSFTLPDSPQQNGIAVRRIGLVMEVTRTSVIYADAPHFLWPFAVRYAAHQLNLWPRVSLPETSPTLRWTGEFGDASMFRVWGSRAFVRDTSADKLSARAIPCVFLGFVPDAPGWQFYHPTLRHVLPSQDVTFHESVPFYRLFLYRSTPPPPPPLFLSPGPPSVDPLPPQGPAPSSVSQVDPHPDSAPVLIAVGSGAARGAVSGGAASGDLEPGGAESEGAGSGGAEPGDAEPPCVEPGGIDPRGDELEGVESRDAEPRGAASSGGPVGDSPRLSLQQLSEWLVRRAHFQSGATRAGGAGDAGAGGAGVSAGAGGPGGSAPACLGGARTRGAGAAGTSGVGGVKKQE